MKNLNYSLVFSDEITGGFFYKAGISGGGIVWGEVYPDSYAESASFLSPHSEVNSPRDSMFALGGYFTKVKGIGPELGAGKVWYFNPVHSLRAGFQTKFYHINERIVAAYFSEDGTKEGFGMRYRLKSWCFALGPEVFHQIRISPRMSTFYGLKLPWFIPVRTKKFDTSVNTPVKGLHWFLSLGLSYSIGKKP